MIETKNRTLLNVWYGTSKVFSTCSLHCTRKLYAILLFWRLWSSWKLTVTASLLLTNSTVFFTIDSKVGQCKFRSIEILFLISMEKLIIALIDWITIHIFYPFLSLLHFRYSKIHLQSHTSITYSISCIFSTFARLKTLNKKFYEVFNFRIANLRIHTQKNIE